MNFKYFTFFIILFCSYTCFAQDSKKINQNLYFGLLSKEGFRPEIDEDGDIVFKSEGAIYMIDTEMPTNIFKIAYYLDSSTIVEEHGCNLKFFEAINESLGYHDGCIVRVFENCNSILLKWYVELAEGEKLTKDQLMGAISRIKEGRVNLVNEFKKKELL